MATRKSNGSATVHSKPRKFWGVAFVLAGLAVLSWLVAQGAGLLHQPSMSGGLPSRLVGPSLRWYVQSGQWRADARSLVAAARYVLEPERTIAGGSPEVKTVIAGATANNLVTDTDWNQTSTPL